MQLTGPIYGPEQFFAAGNWSPYLRWAYTVSVFCALFVRTENISPFFMYVYVNSILIYPLFFVIRTKAHLQILRTHRVEHGSTFDRSHLYQ